MRSREIDPRDFRLMRAYALVLMCINTGTRNKEIRFAEVRGLDAIHVKKRHHILEDVSSQTVFKSPSERAFGYGCYGRHWIGTTTRN